ncbi:hypothetical protein VrSk94_39310 [Vibrio rotiferianus]
MSVRKQQDVKFMKMMKLRYRIGMSDQWTEVVVSMFVAQSLAKEYLGYGWQAEVLSV